MGDVVPDGEPASVTFPWDAATTSVVAQCDIGEIEVRLAPGHVPPDAPRDLLLPCTGKGEPEVGVIPRTLVRDARPGKPFESLATPVGAARGRPYAVALMSGDQVVDLSRVHDTQGGYSFREANGFVDGQPGGRGSAEPLPDGALPESPTAPVRLPSRATRVRVTVHCQGAGGVTITGDRGPVGGPVSCAADRELYGGSSSGAPTRGRGSGWASTTRPPARTRWSASPPAESQAPDGKRGAGCTAAWSAPGWGT